MRTHPNGPLLNPNAISYNQPFLLLRCASTAGESHGEALVALLSGMPAGVAVDREFVDRELWRRQQGYGRGGRMRIERDQAHILSGVRHGKTIGSPIAMLLANNDWQNWTEALPVEEGDPAKHKRASTLNSNYPLPVTVTLSGTGGTPTGTVTLSAPGYTSSAVTLNASGVASFTIPADTFTAITSGSITLSASYSGDASYTSNTGSATVTVTYVPVLFPTVTVAPASSTVNSNASLNVTATVTGASTSEASPTGTVTLSGGGLTPTLTGTLSGGSYIFTIPPNSLNPGVETLTVTYSGDPFYYPGTGTGNVTVSESTFSLEASATTAIANPGGSATSTITATAIAGYTGTATLTACTLVNYTPGDADLPTCSLSGTTLTMGGAGVIATVLTTSSNSSLAYPKMPGKGRGWEGAGGGALLASLLFLGIPARRRGWRSMLGILVVMAALGSLSACGSSSSSTSGGTGTTPDNYIFMVTATGNPSVAPAPSVTFSVVVN